MTTEEVVDWFVITEYPLAEKGLLKVSSSILTFLREKSVYSTVLRASVRQLYKVASDIPSSFASATIEHWFGGNIFFSTASLRSGE